MRRPSAGARRAVTAVYGLAPATASVLPSGADAPGGWDKAISPSLENRIDVPAYAGLAWLACAAWSFSRGVRARRVPAGALRSRLAPMGCPAILRTGLPRKGPIMECLCLALWQPW